MEFTNCPHCGAEGSVALPFLERPAIVLNPGTRDAQVLAEAARASGCDDCGQVVHEV